MVNCLVTGYDTLLQVCFSGKVIDREFDDEEMEEEEDDMDSFPFKEEEESEEANETSFQTVSSDCNNEAEGNSSNNEIMAEEIPPSLKPSVSDTGDFVTQLVVNPKPDLREFPRQTNKDTLSILKAKRIIRHKHADGPEMKKLKSDQLE